MTSKSTISSNLSTFLKTLLIRQSNKWKNKPSYNLLLNPNIHELQRSINKIIKTKISLTKSTRKKI